MLKVALVDDEAWCLKELYDFLISTGMVEIVGVYESSLEALAAMEGESPDIAFIDVLMPGMSGLDLAKRLKLQWPRLKVILVSANDGYARYGFDIGVDDYILKPLRRERILRALERAV